MTPSSDDALALFRRTPDQFIAARDVLAKQLGKQGEAEEAKRVKALRKPTVPAWALNQLVERDHDGVDELLDAGAELRAAQQATLSSARNAPRMRAASEQRRQAVTRLARVASEVLAESERTSKSHLDEVTAGLEAASVDEDAAEHLRTGTFERPPQRPSGLGEVFGLTSVPSADEPAEGTPPTGRGRSSQAPDRSKGPAADRDVILRAEVAKLRRDRDSVVRRLGKDREAAGRYVREQKVLEARLQKIQEKLDEAEGQAKTGETEVREAERALKRAEARLSRARDS